MILQLDKRAEFIRWYAAEGGPLANGHGQPPNAISNYRKESPNTATLDAIRQLQDTWTLAQAEGLLADVAMEGQDVVIKSF